MSPSTLSPVSRVLSTMTTDFRPGHWWLSCSHALAAHGVDGDHRALDGQQLEQRGNGDDLVGLFADLGLPEHHALARGEGRDDMNGLFAPFLLVGEIAQTIIDKKADYIIDNSSRPESGPSADDRGPSHRLSCFTSIQADWPGLCARLHGGGGSP